MTITTDQLMALISATIAALAVLYVRRRLIKQDEQERRLTLIEKHHYDSQEVESAIERAIRPLAEDIKEQRADIKESNRMLLEINRRLPR